MIYSEIVFVIRKMLYMLATAQDTDLPTGQWRHGQGGHAPPPSLRPVGKLPKTWVPRRHCDWNFSRSPANYVLSSYTSLKKALDQMLYLMAICIIRAMHEARKLNVNYN
jgi:hypothetical protein